MQVDTAEARSVLKKRETVAGEHLRGGVRILGLTRKIEPRHHTGVLVKARALRQATQRAFDRSHSRLKLLVGQAFFVDAGESEQASVTAALESEDLWPDKACNRNDAARRSRLGEPRSMFELLSVYAGHSSSSG